MTTSIRKALQQRDQGFTLIELLVVIIVIGVLAAIAIPTYLNQRKKAIDASVKSDLSNAAKALEAYNVDNPQSFERYGNRSAYDNGFTLSEGNFLAMIGDPAEGYCIYGRNYNVSGIHWYDSEKGYLGWTSNYTPPARSERCITTNYPNALRHAEPAPQPLNFYTVWSTPTG